VVSSIRFWARRRATGLASAVQRTHRRGCGSWPFRWLIKELRSLPLRPRGSLSGAITGWICPRARSW